MEFKKIICWFKGVNTIVFGFFLTGGMHIYSFVQQIAMCYIYSVPTQGLKKYTYTHINWAQPQGKKSHSTYGSLWCLPPATHTWMLKLKNKSCIKKSTFGKHFLENVNTCQALTVNNQGAIISKDTDGHYKMNAVENRVWSKSTKFVCIFETHYVHDMVTKKVISP